MPSANINPGGTRITARAFGIKPTWQNIAATSGTDSTVAIALFYGSTYVPGDCLVQGIGYLVGSAGGTGKVIVSLHDADGVVLTQSAVAGTVIGTAAQTQEVAFTAPYQLQGPGTFLLAVTFNEAATRKYRTVPAYCDGGMLGGTATQTFVAITSFTPAATRFTADQSPICYLY